VLFIEQRIFCISKKRRVMHLFSHVEPASGVWKVRGRGERKEKEGSKD
jgi:hypothetical protein